MADVDAVPVPGDHHPVAGTAAPSRLHPLSPVLDVLDRNLLAPGIVALGSGGLRVVAGLVLVVALLRTVGWSRRTFLLDGGVLRVSSGVLARNEQLVPCDRIQQVNLVQKLRHRLFGVAALRVEIAGGGRGSGVELAVLSLDTAGALRDALLAAKAQAVTGSTEPVVDPDGGAAANEGQPAWVPAAWPVVRLSTRQLVVAGLTGSELLVLFAFVASAVQLLGDAPGIVPSTGGFDLADPGAPAIALLVLVFLVVWLGSAIGASVLRDAGYALDLVGDELHLTRGLLDRKESVLPLARVQAVQITATPLRRPLGYVSLRVQSASAGTEHQDRRVSVPILPVAELRPVLDLLLPGSSALPPLVPAPLVARRRAVVRAVWPVAVVAAVVVAGAYPWGLLAFVLLVPATGFGLLTYRGLGHAVGPAHLTSRSGALVRRTVIVPLARAQSTRVRESPLQRRLGLASCIVDVAGPGRRPRVTDVEVETAVAIADRVVTAVGGR